jgi:hypothetical protein
MRLALGLAAVLIFVLAISFSVKRYSQPQAAPPEALAHIAQKNRDAAVVAAAHQRAESAATTNAAEDLAEAQRRGSAEANAVLSRFPDSDARNATAARQD